MDAHTATQTYTDPNDEQEMKRTYTGKHNTAIKPAKKLFSLYSKKEKSQNVNERRKEKKTALSHTDTRQPTIKCDGCVCCVYLSQHSAQHIYPPAKHAANNKTSECIKPTLMPSKQIIPCSVCNDRKDWKKNEKYIKCVHGIDDTSTQKRIGIEQSAQNGNECVLFCLALFVFIIIIYSVLFLCVWRATHTLREPCTRCNISHIYRLFAVTACKEKRSAQWVHKSSHVMLNIWDEKKNSGKNVNWRAQK